MLEDGPNQLRSGFASGGSSAIFWAAPEYEESSPAWGDGESMLREDKSHQGGSYFRDGLGRGATQAAQGQRPLSLVYEGETPAGAAGGYSALVVRASGSDCGSHCRCYLCRLLGSRTSCEGLQMTDSK